MESVGGGEVFGESFGGLPGALMMFADGIITSNTMITWPFLGSSDMFLV